MARERRWRWSAHAAGVGGIDVAGEIDAEDAFFAISVVARDQGCASMANVVDAMKHWHTGGIGKFTTSAGQTLTIVVVEFGRAR